MNSSYVIWFLNHYASQGRCFKPDLQAENADESEESDDEEEEDDE